MNLSRDLSLRRLHTSGFRLTVFGVYGFGELTLIRVERNGDGTVC